MASSETQKFNLYLIELFLLPICFIYQLKVHERIHENNLLTCQFCQYTATRPEIMIDHLDVHFNLLKYICEYCNRKFPRLSFI